MNEVDELWIKMRGAKCQYCKHHADSLPNNFWACSRQTIVMTEDLKALKCLYYEWESKLTKYDFEEDVEISPPSVKN